ncbi:MAG: efflux RND transporter periplasmic adaptor subunit [Hydrogenophaga sp.]|uniref:efflux RND transporter periplasmic adaptor subunit n=1 Tax=Hydrogenophaga sp. TaxID=1904254 RepID=UPI002728EAAC|nr:efflux RND transporter periplasmic adaptor subunit [Hydrogenophaga sp.]MDO9503723.1 efflux RND transporter periplasmic adaptor subunit [Hydrogenophaga sp.]MDP3628110.1 efflux RND transporter periplasmic adaptor subunit [Hydrogenophaga sp.]
MAQKSIYVLVAIAGIGLASGAAWWLQNKPSAPSSGVAAAPTGGARSAGNAPGVEVTKVKAVRLQDDAQAVGTLRSRQSVTLKPEVSGRVARIAFADGAQVRAGQLLVQLDDTLQRAELSQAQAQLSIARANLKRNQELVAENFVATRVVEESLANLQVAEAQVALATARMQRMRITAPFNGTVGLRSINLGQYVKDGDDLANLEDTSLLTVDFRLPERYQSSIASGQVVQVQLDALPGKTFEATVLAVDPLLDANGRSISVRAVMPRSSGADLRPGMFARVLIVFSVNDAALVVPEEAMVPQGGKQFVFLLDEQGQGDAKKLVSRRVEVEAGVRRGAEVQIVKGVAAGDTVVVAGQQRLQRDGTAVRVVNMARTTEAAPQGGKPATP